MEKVYCFLMVLSIGSIVLAEVSSKEKFIARAQIVSTLPDWEAVTVYLKASLSEKDFQFIQGKMQTAKIRPADSFSLSLREHGFNSSKKENSFEGAPIEFLAAGKFLYNGQSFTFSESSSFEENYRRLERRSPRAFSLFLLFIPESYAGIKDWIVDIGSRIGINVLNYALNGPVQSMMAGLGAGLMSMLKGFSANIPINIGIGTPSLATKSFDCAPSGYKAVLTSGASVAGTAQGTKITSGAFTARLNSSPRSSAVFTATQSACNTGLVPQRLSANGALSNPNLKNAFTSGRQ